jgi:hypothetical protein
MYVPATTFDPDPAVSRWILSIDVDGGAAERVLGIPASAAGGEEERDALLEVVIDRADDRAHIARATCAVDRAGSRRTLIVLEGVRLEESTHGSFHHADATTPDGRTVLAWSFDAVSGAQYIRTDVPSMLGLAGGTYGGGRVEPVRRAVALADVA